MVDLQNFNFKIYKNICLFSNRQMGSLCKGSITDEYARP